jgi:hypothetical protein
LGKSSGSGPKNEGVAKGCGADVDVASGGSIAVERGAGCGSDGAESVAAPPVVAHAIKNNRVTLIMSVVFVFCFLIIEGSIFIKIMDVLIYVTPH